MTDTPFTHRITVRYGEVDMQRVVFNAHYLAYCDDACEQWFRHCGLRGLDNQWDFMLKKATIEWSGAATVGDVIDIAVAIGRWGNTSFTVVFDGRVAGGPIFTCEIVYVGVKMGTTETMRVPDAVRAALGEPVATV